jgi:hypothetical protein
MAFREETRERLPVRKSEGESHLEDLDVEGRIIL